MMLQKSHVRGRRERERERHAHTHTQGLTKFRNLLKDMMHLLLFGNKCAIGTAAGPVLWLTLAGESSLKRLSSQKSNGKL